MSQTSHPPKKRVLFFMAENPVKGDAGNKTHVLQLLKYFDERQEFFECDYIGIRDWEGWTEKDAELLQKQLPNAGISFLRRKAPKTNILTYFFTYKLPLLVSKPKLLLGKQANFDAIPDSNNPYLQKQFDQLLREKKAYDFIIINYVFWTGLIQHNPLVGNARLIIDTHDLMTSQLKNGRKFRLGPTFAREMELLSFFHEVWSVSVDEQYLFGQFTQAKQRFIPIMYERKYNNETGKQPLYDLIYVASANQNNKDAATWFFTSVFPLLPVGIRICVIGKISDEIADLPGVQKHLYVNNLDELYLQSKIAICPMLNGTGIKVKTVEALSYGLPVVCTLRGLDGLPVKENNGCLLGDDPEAFASHIRRLLSDREYYTRIKNMGIATFEQYFEKQNCYHRLDNILQVN